MKTAEQALAKWLQGTANAADAMRAGVNALGPEKNPMELAAQKEQKWADNVARAARLHKFANGCRAVDLNAWRQAYINKGIPNYQNGTQFAKEKMRAFLNVLITYEQSVVQALQPRVTLAQNKQRMTQFFDMMSAASYNKATKQMQTAAGATMPGAS